MNVDWIVLAGAVAGVAALLVVRWRWKWGWGTAPIFAYAVGLALGVAAGAFGVRVDPWPVVLFVLAVTALCFLAVRGRRSEEAPIYLRPAVLAAGYLILGVALAIPRPSHLAEEALRWASITPVEACNAAGWQAPVSIDQPPFSVTLFVKGGTEMECIIDRGPAAAPISETWVNVRPDEPAALTFDLGGLGFGDPPNAIIGRTPGGTATVVITTPDEQKQAVVSGGFYMALMRTGAQPTRVVAFDANGVELARLEDAGGLRPL
jgi:hypothetical protein